MINYRLVELTGRNHDHVGLIVFAHGSSIEEANDAVRRVADATAARCGFSLWGSAFLDVAQPDLAATVRDLAARGAKKIVVAPYFLAMGVHLQQDLPQLVEQVSRLNPRLEVICCAPLDGHPSLVDILAARVEQALAT